MKTATNFYHACNKLSNISKTKFNTYLTKLVCSIGPILFASPIHAQEYVAVPDSAFEQFLITEGLDKDGKNGKILKSSVDTIKTLDIYAGGIVDLAGIEAFTALRTLYGPTQSLQQIDVSKNLALQRLHCSEGQLTSIDLSKNINLKFLYIGYNKLTTIDVNKNLALEELDFTNNLLDSIDLSKNLNLRYIGCSNNRLQRLDVSSNVLLSKLYCVDNKLTTLDLTQNTALNILSCAKNNLKELNLASNTALTSLFCHMNQLGSLDLSHNTALNNLYCSANALASLDLSNNILLERLSCGSNHFEILNLSYNTNLKQLDCLNNPELKTICISENTDVDNFQKDDTAAWSINCDVTGLYSAYLYSDMSLYPNPSDGTFNIETKKAMAASIVNILGVPVADLQLQSGQNIVSLALEQGIYYVKMDGQMLKFIIQ